MFWRTIFLHTFWGFVLMSVGMNLSCASKESRQRTLSIFFDGVPKDEEGDEEDQKVTGAGQETQPTVRQEVVRYSFHDPYASRECESCHSSKQALVLIATKERLCATCHDGSMFEGHFVHGPVAAGQCGACHEPHKSRFPHLLKSEGSNVCVDCHDSTTVELETHSQQVGEDCLACHSPHSSSLAALLR